MKATKSKVEYRGLVCNSCQETIGTDRCISCGTKFMEDDIIYCINHSQLDCEHCCEGCYDKQEH